MRFLPLLLGSVLFTNSFGLDFCSVEVKNDFPIQQGFIDYYLTQRVSQFLEETGWRLNCPNGTTVRVEVQKLSFKGSAIGANRFSGYTFRISFKVVLPKKSYSYSFSKFVPLPDPSLGTYGVREALVDIFDTYSLKIKKDLLDYRKEFGKN